MGVIATEPNNPHRREFLRAVMALTAGAVVASPLKQIGGSPLLAPLDPAELGGLVEVVPDQRIATVEGQLGLCWGPISIPPRCAAFVYATAPRNIAIERVRANTSTLKLCSVFGWSAHYLPLAAYAKNGIRFSSPQHHEAGAELAIRLYNPEGYAQTFLAAAL